MLHSVIALLRGKLCEKNIPKICPGKMFSEIVREKYSPNSSFQKSFAHFVVGGSVLSTGSKYLETANMSRANKGCAAKKTD